MNGYNLFEDFWKADEISHKENCFSKEAKQVALGIRMSDECVFSELNEKGDPWGKTERNRRIELNKRYNEKALDIVGIKLLGEEYNTKDMEFPQVKKIGEVFDGIYEYKPFQGEWLSSSVKTEKQLEGLLDKVDKMNIREFMFPKNWEIEKKRIYETYGKKPQQLRHIRGPVTLAMSIFGEENLIYLYFDEEELFKRFSSTISKVVIEMSEIMDVEAGYTNGNAPHGFSFADDNCALLNPEMYEIFGYPVLDRVFERFSPDVGDERYQHSDSQMNHLLPLLGRLNLTGCNFGPTVLVDEIREYMINTRIDGCLAPFTFMNNNKDDIVFETKRDIEMVKASKTKGLNITTAGSINDGSLLTSLRTIMETILEFGQY